ncbi:hypothetical protein AAE478_010360 [Parahypoxylon ruwenzoriense]
MYTPNWYPKTTPSKQPCPICTSELATETRLIDHTLIVVHWQHTEATRKKTTQCDRLATAVTSLTSNPTDKKFSKRDRFRVNFHESKIRKFNVELGDCQRTISMVLVSINIIIAKRTVKDAGQLGRRFLAQEQALADLDTRLLNRQTSHASKEASASDRDASLQMTAELRKICQEALSATKAKRFGQEFRGMSTDDQSQAMQGVVGKAQDGVEQSFGMMKTSTDSRAFQGQMDPASFAIMFERAT